MTRPYPEWFIEEPVDTSAQNAQEQPAAQESQDDFELDFDREQLSDVLAAIHRS